LKLKYDEALSNSAFKFDLCHYCEGPSLRTNPDEEEAGDDAAAGTFTSLHATPRGDGRDWDKRIAYHVIDTHF
jgi:hypothetical protein